MPGRHDRALRKRECGDAQGRGHRLVQVDQVEALLAEDVADTEDAARREDDVRQGAVRRHDHRPADGDDPGREIAVAARARMEKPRGAARRIVTHENRDIVTACPEGRRLILRVLDHPTPVGPRERDDDPDLHPASAKAPASRSMPSSRVSSGTARESRAHPAPLGPKPSPGASATRCSVSSRSWVNPSGSRSQT